MSTSLAEHATTMRKLLSSEWQVPGYKRSWHAEYSINGDVWHAALVQTKHAEGFQVGLVKLLYAAELTSGAAVSSRAACIWLGLEAVNEPLDWHYEL